MALQDLSVSRLGGCILAEWGRGTIDLLTEERTESFAEPVQSRRRYSRIPGKAGAGPTINQRDELDFKYVLGIV